MIYWAIFSEPFFDLVKGSKTDLSCVRASLLNEFSDKRSVSLRKTGKRCNYLLNVLNTPLLPIEIHYYNVVFHCSVVDRIFHVDFKWTLSEGLFLEWLGKQLFLAQCYGNFIKNFCWRREKLFGVFDLHSIFINTRTQTPVGEEIFLLSSSCCIESSSEINLMICFMKFQNSPGEDTHKHGEK